MEEEEIEPQPRISIQEEIQDLHNLHLVTKSFNHGIQDSGPWMMFEPSRFVYSYFAFNSYYNFDWENSCAKRELIEHSKSTIEDNTTRECDSCGYVEKESTSDGIKYKRLSTFYFRVYYRR